MLRHLSEIRSEWELALVLDQAFRISLPFTYRDTVLVNIPFTRPEWAAILK